MIIFLLTKFHETQLILNKRPRSIISWSIHTSYSCISIFELKKFALLLTLLPYALLDFFAGTETLRAVLLLQFVIVYRVLSSKMWQNENASKFTKRLQMSLSTRFGWKFWFPFLLANVHVRPCQFCNLRVTTLWVAGCWRSVDVLIVQVYNILYSKLKLNDFFPQM